MTRCPPVERLARNFQKGSPHAWPAAPLRAG
jgi:hypothetical protein